MSGEAEDYEPVEGEDFVICRECLGSGLSIEGWDCEECDGTGFWEI